MALNNTFADIHPHTSFKYAYNEMDLWKSINIPHLLIERIIGMTAYSQSDFRRMALGGTQIAFVGLNAIEQRMSFMKDPLGKIMDRLDSVTYFLTKIPADSIDFIRSDQYDHYSQVLKEKDLLKSNQHRSRKIYFKKLKFIKCKFEIVHNYNRIEEIIELNKNDKSQFTIAVVLTMEGIYNLGTGHLSFNGHNKFNVSEDRLLKRIDNLKGIDNDEGPGWQFSPVWMGLGHIFYNGIYGYPQALKEGFKKIFVYSDSVRDQNTDLNKGMNSQGKRIIKRMLGIEEESDVGGRRIHVDIKHLSTRCRKEYYEIIDAYNENHPNDIIPVIMSHGAVNGKPTLDDMNYIPPDTDKEQEDSTGFNPWSINIYDDEILRVHQTQGLIGVMLDERIISGKQKIKDTKGRGKKKWGKIFADQIEHIVKTVYSSNLLYKEEIWDRISIGSDFDGQINPANAFHTSKKFPNLRKALEYELSGDRFNPYRNASEISTILNKICHDNALNFLKRHFDN